MKTYDIYNEERIGRMLHIQQANSVDFENSIPWSTSIDLTKPLLPLDSGSPLFPDTTEAERIAISQIMGLVVAASISQLESVAVSLQGPTWDKVLRKYPVGPEFRALGEHFYEDEAKHSLAFDRYIDLFATQLGLEAAELKAFLPSSDSMIRKIYALNSRLGGTAIWWLIAALEEESIEIYKRMRNSTEELEPVYLGLHRAHFEEEIRHKSYAVMMLQLHRDQGTRPFGKFDFLLSETLNFLWSFNQLAKLRGIGVLRNRHPFFATIAGLCEKIRGRNTLQVMSALCYRTPYTRGMIQLSQHREVQELLKEFGGYRLPLGSANEEQLCTV